ncbi:MAG: hypothetical protein NDJ89_18025 [Oligoflexia bacterium]|nr:hypothetical protein [Oligoflexia bacterium]
MSESFRSARRFAAALALVACLPLKAALANAELDRKYALESIGFLRASDNIDGLFSDYVAAAYRDYFNQQSHFVLQDLTRADAVLSRSSLPYHKVIEDAEILGQLARVTRTQSMVRTRISKEGPQYRFSLQWLHSPAMELLASEEIVLREKADGRGFSLEELRGALRATLDRLIGKVPFRGTVTGRDNASVTVNLGMRSGIKRGDMLEVATLDEVKKHPLLKEIVEWRLTPTGKLLVEQVEEGMAFCRVVEEDSGRQIGRYQKISQVISGKTPPESREERTPESEVSSAYLPSLGWTAVSLWGGAYGRSFSSSTSQFSGGGIVLGAAANAQLWLTRDWFAELGFGHGIWSYSQQDDASGTEVTSGRPGSATAFRVAAGYSYLVTGNFFGPKAWVKFGFHSISVSLPADRDNKLAPNSFKSPFIGIGGDLPIRSNYGALLDFQFGAFPSGTESGGDAGSINSASDVTFFLGGYYRWNARMTIRAGIDVTSNSADYSSGAALSQKIITFSPALLYYF